MSICINDTPMIYNAYETNFIESFERGIVIPTIDIDNGNDIERVNEVVSSIVFTCGIKAHIEDIDQGL